MLGERKLFIFLIIVFFKLNFCFASFLKVSSIEEAYIKRIIINPLEPKIIFVASKNCIYKSQDSGISFEKLFAFKDEEIVSLFFDEKILYILTTRNLYKLEEQLKKIFSLPEELINLSIIKFKEKIYIGTTGGLYTVEMDSLISQKFQALKEETIYSMDKSKDNLYIATSRGIYILENGELKRVFVFREKEETTEERSGFYPNIIKVDLLEPKTIYLGTNKGLYYSKDCGKIWKKLYLEGLSGIDINCITQNRKEKNIIYVCSSNGFFKIDLKNKNVYNIYEGLETNQILWAAILENKFFLATKNGLYEWENKEEKLVVDIDKLLEGEPSIEEIRREALKYNEVSPEKISSWRTRLKVRAFLPTVSLSYSKNVWGTSGGATYEGKYIVGPKDWSVNFSWDVADLIWNSYEDDVDTRSRLNTQLRLDILDEINRVYFERIRIKKELANLVLSEDEALKKKLRLLELEAILDGYTGGYFSKRLRELNEKR